MSGRVKLQAWHGLLILGLLCVKLPLLMLYGPTLAPDSGGYIGYAHGLLSGTAPSLAMHSFSDSMVFRAVGYPAIIAGAILLAGAAWPWLVVTIQTGLTLGVSLLVGDLALRLTGRARWAVAAGLAYGLSLPLALDQMILTDSVAASCLALPACLLAQRVLMRQRLSLSLALGLGLVLMAAFLVREATIYFAGLGILPLALAAAFADRLRDRGASPDFAMRRLLTALVVILPMLVGAQAYRLWNQARLGVPFITTAAQTTLLYGMSKVAATHPEVFDRSRLVDRVAAETLTAFDFGEIWQINRRLYFEHGMTSDRIAAAAYDSYFRAWLREPLLMLRLPLGHIRPSFARAWLQPVRSAFLLDTWATNREAEPNLRHEIMAGHWLLAPLYLLDLLCIAVALPVFAAFLFGAPWRLWRQGCTPVAVAGIGLWFLFVAYYGGYAIVHLEARYLIGVLAGVTAVGLGNIVALWRWFVARRRAVPVRGTGSNDG